MESVNALVCKLTGPGLLEADGTQHKDAWWSDILACAGFQMQHKHVHLGGSVAVDACPVLHETFILPPKADWEA